MNWKVFVLSFVMYEVGWWMNELVRYIRKKIESDDRRMFNREVYEEICDKAKKYDDLMGVLEQIRTEIGKAWYIRPKNKYEEGLKDQALKDMEILDKYMEVKE